MIGSIGFMSDQSFNSLYETITILTIFHRRDCISDDQLSDLERSATGLAKQLNALIGKLKRSN